MEKEERQFEYQREFNYIRRSLERLEENVTLLRVDVGGLKIKSGVWGLIGGMIPVAIIVILWLVREAR